ncbi:MAG: hypothetical protein WD824_00995 [Cyclobacteriaceae bacterium]
MEGNLVIPLEKISRALVALVFVSTAVFIQIQGFQVNLAQLMLVILFLILLAFSRLMLHKEITLFLGFYFIISIVIALINGFSIIHILISYLVLNMYAAVLNTVFHLHKGRIEKLLALYLNIAFLAGILGVIQEISFLSNFRPGYDFKWLFNAYAKLTYSGIFLKVPSIFTEPGYFAPFMVPAAYLSLKSLIFRSGEVAKIKAIIIVAALLFTFSIIGYLGLFLCLVVLFRKNWIIGISLGVLFTLYAAVNVASIKSRTDSVLDFFHGNLSINANFSALVTILNYHITTQSFMTRPIFGAGIDGYEMVSSQIMAQGFPNEVLNKYISMNHPDSLMVKDGSNLFFRIIVEFGLIGIFLIGFFMLSKFSEISYVRSIQLMCLIFIVTYSLRTGQYLRFELWFFIMLYVKIKGEEEYFQENQS